MISSQIIDTDAQAIIDVSSSISYTDDFRQLVNVLFETVNKYIHFDWIGFFFFNAFETRVSVMTNDNLPFDWNDHYLNIADYDKLSRLTIGGIPGDIFTSREAFDPMIDEDAFVLEYIRKHSDTEHCLVAPLVKEGKMWMGFGIYRAIGEDHFSESDKRLIRTLLPLMIFKCRTMLICQQYNLKMRVVDEFISRQGVYTLLLDENLALIDYPETTRRMLAEFYGNPALHHLPQPMLNWIKTVIAPTGTLKNNRGTWFFEEDMPNGRLRCMAYSISGNGRKPLLMIKIEPHGPRDDFSALDKFGLSEREVEVVSYLPLGYSNAQIARALDIKEVTVKKHLKNAGEKLGASGKTEILYHAVKVLMDIGTH